MPKIPVTYHFKDLSCLQNGSFYRQSNNGIFRYVLGDYSGETDRVPKGLKSLGVKEAQEYLPERFRIII